MKLNADRTRALLNINAELDAARVEEAIRALAMLRSQMAPAVAMYPAADGSTRNMTQDSPSLLIDNPAADGTVMLRLRSVGVGWTSWRLYPDQTEAIRTTLNGFNGQPTAAPGGQKH